MRPGLTLIELVLVCTFTALVAAIGLPRAQYVLDGLRLRQASHEVAGAMTLARAAAIRRGAYTRLIVVESASAVHVESAGDTLLRRELGRLHRVAIRASRDTITYAPTGLGYGIANSTIVVTIGQRAETLTVSRLGRMRTSW
jgi:Tfp pilus assembly protein FimT